MIPNPIDVVTDAAGAVAGALGGAASDYFIDPVVDFFTGIMNSIYQFFADLLITAITALAGAVLGKEALILSESWVGISNSLRSNLWYITAFMVAAGVLWQSLRMIWNKNGEPLSQLLKATAIFIFVAGSGLALVQGASEASDEVAKIFFDDSQFEDVAESFQRNFAGESRILVLFVVFIPFSLVMGFIWIITFLKDILVVVCSGVLLLAAAGQYFGFSRTWLNKIIGTTIAALLYKPGIAFLVTFSLQIMLSGGFAGLMIGPWLLIAGVWVAKPLTKVFTSMNYAGSIGSGASFGTGAIGSRSSGSDAQMPTGTER